MNCSDSVIFYFSFYFYDFSSRFMNCSDSVLFFYFSFYFQDFAIRFMNSSDSVILYIFYFVTLLWWGTHDTNLYNNVLQWDNVLHTDNWALQYNNSMTKSSLPALTIRMLMTCYMTYICRYGNYNRKDSLHTLLTNY